MKADDYQQPKTQMLMTRRQSWVEHARPMLAHTLPTDIVCRIDMMQEVAPAVSSTAAPSKLAKEVVKLKNKHVEQLTHDEQLRHYAEMRIALDLDDGVKVNYGKFGDLFDSVKVVTGGSSDD